MSAGITFCRCSFEKLLFESEFLHTLCNFSSCCFDKLTLLTTNSKLGLMMYLRSFFKLSLKKLFTTSLVLQFTFTNRNLDYPYSIFLFNRSPSITTRHRLFYNLKYFSTKIVYTKMRQLKQTTLMSRLRALFNIQMDIMTAGAVIV